MSLQSVHLITWSIITQMTIDKIFLDDRNVFARPQTAEFHIFFSEYHTFLESHYIIRIGYLGIENLPTEIKQNGTERVRVNVDKNDCCFFY